MALPSKKSPKPPCRNFGSQSPFFAKTRRALGVQMATDSLKLDDNNSPWRFGWACEQAVRESATRNDLPAWRGRKPPTTSPWSQCPNALGELSFTQEPKRNDARQRSPWRDCNIDR
jgi:hypothetical protein